MIDISGATQAQESGEVFADPCSGAWDKTKSALSLALAAGGSMDTAAYIGARYARPLVYVDANIIRYSAQYGEAWRVQSFMAGRSPVVPPAAAEEVIQHIGRGGLNYWAAARGGRFGPEATPAGVQQLATDLAGMGRAPFTPRDARIATAAREAGITLLSADRKVVNGMQDLNIPAVRYFPGP